jgi:hypothetical protein
MKMPIPAVRLVFSASVMFETSRDAFLKLSLQSDIHPPCGAEEKSTSMTSTSEGRKKL